MRILGKIFINLFVLVTIGTGFVGPNKILAAADPGCYKIDNGTPQKLTCPTSNVIYDDGRGGNLSAPNPQKCYIYSQNLYDGDPTWGEPYVQVDCSKLAPCPSGQELRYNQDASGPPTCVDVNTSLSGTYAGGGTPPASSSYNPAVSDADGKKLVGWIDTITTTLSAITGLAVTISIIFAGIQYSTAGGNPQAAAAAKKRIGQAVTALVATALMYFFLQWIVVGGIF